MSELPPPYRIGGFNIHCFHNCTQAAAIHAELKKLHIDAAVVDHAFVFSPLQLAVAIFRVESNIEVASLSMTASTDTDEQQRQQEQQQEQQTVSSHAVLSDPPVSAGLPTRRMSVSRRVFASLSLTHNLDRILQILPPGPQTSSVVILYRSPVAPSPTPLTSPLSPAAETPRRGGGGGVPHYVSTEAAERERALETAIYTIVHTSNPTAVEHSFLRMSEPFWCGTALDHAEVAKVMEYYSVSETMLLAAQQSLTRRDVQHICRTVEGGVEEVQRRAMRWYALQLCVTTQLAACTA